MGSLSSVKPLSTFLALAREASFLPAETVKIKTKGNREMYLYRLSWLAWCSVRQRFQLPALIIKGLEPNQAGWRDACRICDASQPPAGAVTWHAVTGPNEDMLKSQFRSQTLEKWCVNIQICLRPKKRFFNAAYKIYNQKIKRRVTFDFCYQMYVQKNALQFN